MARKNVLLSQIASAQSLAASFNSEPTIVKYTDNVSYQINVNTTDSSGTFVVQVSLDYDVDQPTGASNRKTAHWVDLITMGTAAGANDVILTNLNQLPFNAIRVAYTSSVAGTGTCDIYIMSKEIGG